MHLVELPTHPGKLHHVPVLESRCSPWRECMEGEEMSKGKQGTNEKQEKVEKRGRKQGSKEEKMGCRAVVVRCFSSTSCGGCSNIIPRRFLSFGHGILVHRFLRE